MVKTHMTKKEAPSNDYIRSMAVPSFTTSIGNNIAMAWKILICACTLHLTCYHCQSLVCFQSSGHIYSVLCSVKMTTSYYVREEIIVVTFYRSTCLPLILVVGSLNQNLRIYEFHPCLVTISNSFLNWYPQKECTKLYLLHVHNHDVQISKINAPIFMVASSYHYFEKHC